MGYEAQDSSAGDRRPAVFMFQPTKFEPVTPERLAEWERSITDYFGLPEPDLDGEAMARGGTWSNCGDGRICADDSDMFDVSGDSGEYEPGGEVAEALAEGRRPTIFMWQPSRFDPVPPDKLAEWERVVREHVGMPATGFSADMAGSRTLSATLPNDCMDDSDYEAE